MDLQNRGVLFRSEHASVKLEGKDIQEFLLKVVPLLDGTRTLKQIHEELSGYKKKDIDKGIGLLMQSGLIEEGGEKEIARMRPQLEFLRDLGFSRELAVEKLKNIRMAVFGLGGHGAHLVTALANEGVGHIRCFDPSKVSDEDLYLSDLYEDDDVGKRREERAVEHLRNAFPHTVFEVSNVENITEQDVTNWIQNCDFAICCVDKSLSSIYFWLNKAALKSGLVWCAGSLDGVEAVIGPMVIPGHTACYMCYKMRLIADESSYLDAIAYEKFLNSCKKDELHRRSNMSINAAILGHFLALESLKHTIGFAPSPLAGRICVINCLTLTTEFHNVLQRPDCPHCSSKKKLQLSFGQSMKRSIYLS